jgi:hypothetical protein
MIINSLYKGLAEKKLSLQQMDFSIYLFIKMIRDLILHRIPIWLNISLMGHNKNY